jgi:hypothetical protein
MLIQSCKLFSWVNPIVIPSVARNLLFFGAHKCRFVSGVQ